MVSDALGLRTIVDNDANAAVYAEYVLGAARGARCAVMLTLGTGVGGGIVIGGALYRGGHGFAGEIGHMTIDTGGRPCGCGNEGCLEGVVSGPAIVAAARALLDQGEPSSLAGAGAGETMSSRDVGDAARAGDRVAALALEAAGRSLGVGLANLVSILDPDVIVVGGGVSAVGEPLLGPARETMRSRMVARGDRIPPVRIAELGELAGVVGAALLARDEQQPR
jgi:glucokinase